GDTRRPETWASHLAGCDTVIHTAAIVSLRGDPQRFWEVNVLGTRRVLEAAARAGARRFVHISSVTAFGFKFPDGVEETWPIRTNGSPYVDTKVAGEQVVLQAHAAGEIPCTIIRPGDVYGPRSPQWTILPLQAIKSKLMLLPANGKGVFSPVFIENLVDGIVAAADSKEAIGQVFTLTDGIGVTTKEFFGYYPKMLGGPALRGAPTPVARSLAAIVERVDRLRGVNTEVNPSTVDYLSRTGTYSIAKARKVLGYSPAVGLDEGMARTEEWLREEGLLT
ncbi:MAG: NAD-dependent epimerase/dehydratase family protein, partial [Actinomycetota bacterium]